MGWAIDALGLVLLIVMIALDRRWRLAFWRIGQLALFTLLVGVGLLLAWESAAVQNGLLIPVSTALSGVQLGAGFPVEEAGITVLLSYATLNAYGAALRWREWRERMRRAGGPGGSAHPGPAHPESGR